MCIRDRNWSALKRPQDLKQTQSDERATYLSKLELFSQRRELKRSKNITDAALADLSFYAFWRLYDVKKKQISRRRREAFISLSGTGWPRQANVNHANHEDYARRTLHAYMPCRGLFGIEYIDNAVRDVYQGSYARALYAFVQDPTNKWCPPWIKINYEVHNKELFAQADFDAEGTNQTGYGQRKGRGWREGCPRYAS